MAGKKSARTGKLRRAQLDRFFAEHAETLRVRRPKTGWLREIRQSLGMTLQDMSSRLGVIKQRGQRIEKDEVAGKVSLHTLEQAANALDCDLVYFIVPRGAGLQAGVESQALKVAKEIVRSTEYTMELEEQGTSGLSQAELIEALAQELLTKQDQRLWKTKNENPKSSRGHASRR